VSSSLIVFQKSGQGREGRRVSVQIVEAEPGINHTTAVEDAPYTSPRTRREVRPVRVGLLGYGRVGQAVAAIAAKAHARLQSAGIDVRCVSALVRDPHKLRLGPAVRLSTDPADVLTSGVDVVVEVLGGLEPARRLVALALDAGIPVVSANKTLVADSGLELQTLAARRGTSFAFDAAVLAGVPFLGSLSRRPLVSDAHEIAGILNGTSNFILTRMAAGAVFDGALAEGIARGYAEPDSSADVEGIDAAQKLAILLQIAGCAGIRSDDLPRGGLDILDPGDFAAARRLGGVIKPVAFASLHPTAGGAWVGPAFLQDGHPFAQVNGVTNGLRLTATNGRAVTFIGPGAGPEVTATTILDDVVEVMNLRCLFAERGQTPHSRGLIPALQKHTRGLSTAPAGRWFVRISDRPDIRAGDLAEFLAANGLPALNLVEDRGRFAGLTAPADWLTAHGVIDALGASGGKTLCVPVFNGACDE
jgi:homoserine dehydrogenase